MSDDRFHNSVSRRLHQRRVRNAASLDGQPVNLPHLLRSQNLHFATIIARREMSAKWRRRRLRSELPSSPSKTDKSWKTRDQNSTFTNQYRER
jgi:hypothetical protein